MRVRTRLIALGLAVVFAVIGGLPACRPAGSPKAEPKITEAPVPTYSVPVLVMNAQGHDDAFGNAVLVDRARGLFITNAHIAAAGKKFKVRVGKGWYGVRVVAISYKRDLALLELDELNRFILPQAAVLNDGTVVGDNVAAKGHMGVKYADGELVTKGYVVDAHVFKVDSPWGISLAASIDAFELEIKQMNGEFIPDTEIHRLYTFYLALRVAGKDHILDGMSGSAVIFPDASVAGILCASNGPLAVAVPAKGIRAFMQEYQDSLKPKPETKQKQRQKRR